MRSGHGGDEELAGVGVGAGVGHGQLARLAVLQGEVLVLELVPVDRVAAEAVPSLKIPALNTETFRPSTIL